MAPTVAGSAPARAGGRSGDATASAAAFAESASRASTRAAAEPAARADPGLELRLPLKVKGTLSKSSRGRIIGRLEAAIAGVTVEGGPYRVGAAIGVSKKKSYRITLTISAAEGPALVEVTEACKGCSLTQAGDTAAALVERAVAELAAREPNPGAVTVTSVPPGATVTVDGEPRGSSPQALSLPPGEHTVTLTKPGFTTLERTITVESDGQQPLELTLEPSPAPRATPEPKGRRRGRGERDARSDGQSDPPPAEPSGPAAGRAWTVAGGVMLGLGLAGVATGAVLILVDENPIPSRCSGADVDFRGVCRYRYDTLLGGIMGVSAGALGIGGGIALMVKGRQVTVRARGGKGSASVGLRVRF